MGKRRFTGYLNNYMPILLAIWRVTHSGRLHFPWSLCARFLEVAMCICIPVLPIFMLEPCCDKRSPSSLHDFPFKGALKFSPSTTAAVVRQACFVSAWHTTAAVVCLRISFISIPKGKFNGLIEKTGRLEDATQYMAILDSQVCWQASNVRQSLLTTGCYHH